MPTDYNKDLIGQSLLEFLSTIVDKIACRYVHGNSKYRRGEYLRQRCYGFEYCCNINPMFYEIIGCIEENLAKQITFLTS